MKPNKNQTNERKTNMKTNAEQIKAAYDNAKFDLASLTNLLEMELAKTPEHLNWAHVGDMRRFRQNLLEMVSAVTGRSEHTLREALDEIREDAKILNEQKNA
jgi:hypothetical protein